MVDETLLKTPLYNLHQELSARLVPFTGYALPIQYQGAIKEHLHCRHKAGLFDISHMGQCFLKVSPLELETVQTATLESLKINFTKYAVFTNENGGIIDDLMITRIAENEFFLVVNGACKAGDFKLLQEKFGADKLTILEDYGLMALQGPMAEKALASFIPEIIELAFMQSGLFEIDGKKCRISRLGYTGEDGFEISTHEDDMEAVARMFLGHETVAPIGLGARDSLRLEAGLCLYGHDIDMQTTPIEAGIAFAVGKKRNQAACFPGADIILRQREQGAPRHRVGFEVEGKMPIREGAEIFQNGMLVGKVTSGGYSPFLEKPIAMGYITSDAKQAGGSFVAKVRDKDIAVKITSPVFFPNRFKR